MEHQGPIAPNPIARTRGPLFPSERNGSRGSGSDRRSSRFERALVRRVLGARGNPPLSVDAMGRIGDRFARGHGRSGEGIRPAVESGLLAARVLRESDGRPSDSALAGYEAAMLDRFGPHVSGGARPWGLSDLLPKPLRAPVTSWLLGSPWFAANVVIDRRFLHRHDPPLAASA